MKSLNELNILIVEDDSATRERIQESLRELGIQGEIYFAENGKVGLEKIDQLGQSNTSLDLVLCDIVMPIMTGIEMLKELRNSSLNYSKVPVLMLTSKSEVEMIVTAVKLGANQYLIKPWNSQTLYQKISEVMKSASK